MLFRAYIQLAKARVRKKEVSLRHEVQGGGDKKVVR